MTRPPPYPGTPPADPDRSDPMRHLEEHIAHLARIVDDLSDVIARQEREIATLTRRVDMLMRREAERDGDAGGGAHFGDERPPHW